MVTISISDHTLTACSSLAEADSRMKGRIMGRQPMASSWPSGSEELSLCLERFSANVRTCETQRSQWNRTDVERQTAGVRQIWVRLFYLLGWRRSALLPVCKERAVERLGEGVAVGAGRGQEPDVVQQRGGSSLRLRNICETSGAEWASD